MTNPNLTPVERSRSRLLEDIGFASGVGIGVFAGVREALGLGPAGFPWILLIVMAALVAPKTLGRATSGRLWSAISTRLGGGAK